jgi:predicted O-linked N-acetylglucosamine transferase (SPINDLY family)
MGSRPYTMAMKPAPIAVGGWGYANGLGIRAMDYLIGDAVSAPEDHAERYPETILRLPVNLPYTPFSGVPEANEAPEVRNGYRTYGYLGRAMKVTGPTIACWAEILRADPTGRLLLKSDQYHDKKQRDAVLDGLAALGVDPKRIEVRGKTSRAEHSLAHRDIDVALDPLRHGGGATIWDAVAMGVPTVTLPGEVISGRQGAAILNHVGQPAWVVDSTEAYVRQAVTMVPAGRWEMQRQALASVGCNPRAYAAAVEDAYREIWARWCKEER